MTEELRKEATTTVQWECTPMIDRPTFINGYIAGAEPREKRIAELENTLSQGNFGRDEIEADLGKKENKKPNFLYLKHDMVDAIAYAIYYTVNPDSEMCVPNCAYIQAEKMFEKWKEEK